MEHLEIRTLQVGSIIQDSNDNYLMVVSIDNLIWFELKWINGTELSKGSIYKVPSHFKDCKIISI